MSVKYFRKAKFLLCLIVFSYLFKSSADLRAVTPQCDIFQLHGLSRVYWSVLFNSHPKNQPSGLPKIWNSVIEWFTAGDFHSHGQVLQLKNSRETHALFFFQSFSLMSKLKAFEEGTEDVNSFPTTATFLDFWKWLKALNLTLDLTFWERVFINIFFERHFRFYSSKFL